MSNSFHLQSECCPNYISLIPSLSCVTGVSCPLLNFFSPYQVLHPFLNQSVVFSFELSHLLRWCYVIVDNFPSCFMIHKFSRVTHLKPSFSLRSSSRFVRTVFFSCLSISIRSVVPSFQVLPILSSFASLLNRSAAWNRSYPLCHSFNSSGGSVLSFSSSIPSSCQIHVQFLPLQSECCPNYIILIPSLYCFNWSVVVIDIYHSMYISFQPECLHVLLVHLNHFCLFFNLQGSRNVPCSSLITGCFQYRSSPLFSLFSFVQSLKVRGFTRLSKKQLSFTSSLPLPFFSGAILDLGTRSSCSGGVL